MDIVPICFPEEEAVVFEKYEKKFSAKAFIIRVKPFFLKDHGNLLSFNHLTL
jgi:hypothetical protein